MSFGVDKKGRPFASLTNRNIVIKELLRWNDPRVIEAFAFVLENDAFLNKGRVVRSASIAGQGSVSDSQSDTDGLSRRLNLVTLVGLASSAE